MSRRLIVRRRDPSGSPLSSRKGGESTMMPHSSPRTTATPTSPAWISTPRRKHSSSNGLPIDDPNVSAIANPPPPPQTPPASLSFLEQLNQTPESELAPEEGALQFVPAFAASGIPGTSWSDDDHDSRFLLQDEKKEEQRSVVSHATNNSSAFAQRARRWKKAQTARKTKSTVETPSAVNTSNTRIARLASLFSSRAVVKGGSGTQASATTATTATTAPTVTQPSPRPTPSPVPSSSSSGYVGWPGTQDKGGRTVSLPSSYDDSSAGPRGSPLATARSDWNPSKRSMSAAQYEASKPQQLPVAPPPPAEQTNFWQHFPDDAWNTADAPPSPSTFSKTSSAYFQPRELRQLAYPDLNEPKSGAYGVAKDLTATILRSSPTVAAGTKTPTRREVTPRNTPSPRGNYTAASSLHYTPTASPHDTHTVSHRQRPIVSPRGVASPRDAPDPQAPTEERLAVRNHLTPIHRPFAAAKGYSGLIQKTKEVPSLMDDNSDTSSRATSAHTASDVFDGLSTSDVFDNLAPSPKKTPRRYPERINEEEETPSRPYPERIDEDEEEDFKVVMLGGGLTAIQSSAFGFDNRVTASDYDDNLTNSDVDNHGYPQTPDLKEMLTAGTNADSALSGIRGNFGNRPRPPLRPSPPPRGSEGDADSYDSGSSMFTDPYVNSVMDVDGELAEYYIDPSEMKKVLRKFRELADRSHADMSLADLEKAEDESKAFALFEMRSRIMEKDIERGLERRGGTVAVDDLVTTPYHMAAHRIRDAVIVSKAWRDGTSPHDVINTSILTRRSERSYFIKRFYGQEPATRYSKYSSPRYYWEAVRWVDDTDFSLYRCPSLGPRSMRGFEMFTVGDCQSILLKLTNERCMELRNELNMATKRQIEAEESMKADGDDGDGMMTEAEMTYLTAMEKVKTISKQLVVAEQSFALVRDRIEKLVERYQSFLLKIETAESFTGASSIVSYTSSHYTDRDSAYWDEEERREAALWARRARRAEIKAEVAAREALLARQEAQMLREEKERELETLRQKLTELQSETSQAISDRLAASRITRLQPPAQSPVQHDPQNGGSLEKTKLDGVKQRFRDRMAARKKMAEESDATSNNVHHQPPRHSNSHRENPQASLMRTAGEEMYQQLDFYERSLRAVNRDN
eukprot:scaffold5215_cov181-Amphora_coffeaeformis.AAC.14